MKLEGRSSRQSGFLAFLFALFVIEIRREMRQAERACWDFLSGWQEAEADVGQIREEEDKNYGDDIFIMMKCLFVCREEDDEDDDVMTIQMMMMMVMVMVVVINVN